VIAKYKRRHLAAAGLPMIFQHRETLRPEGLRAIRLGARLTRGDLAPYPFMPASI
jgi:hypothetical protein